MVHVEALLRQWATRAKQIVLIRRRQRLLHEVSMQHILDVIQHTVETLASKIRDAQHRVRWCAAVSIQNTWRHYQSRKNLIYQDKALVVHLLQITAREIIGRAMAVQTVETILDESRRRHAARLIQRLWRGHRTCRLQRRKRYQKKRKPIRIAPEKTPEALGTYKDKDDEDNDSIPVKSYMWLKCIWFVFESRNR
jgi:hypothetical protein